MQTNNQKPKIALVRGRNLNQWEMQNYAFLMRDFDLRAFTSVKSRFDIKSIKIPITRLKCPDDFYDGIRGFQRFTRTLLHSSIQQKIVAHTGSNKLIGLEKALKGFDIAHTAEVTNYYTYQAIVAKKRGYISRVVVTAWENIPYAAEINRNLQTHIGEICSLVDMFFAVSERAGLCLELFGVPSEKIQIIPTGVDHTIFFPALVNRKSLRQELNLPLDKKIIIGVGRHDWSKGFQDLISALALLAKRNRNIYESTHTIIIGQGRFRPFLEKLIKRYKLKGKIELVSHLPYEIIPKYYQASDVFVLPSTIEHGWQEQFGIVFAEAQSCGLPTVAASSGSISEVVSPDSVLVPPSDFFSLYKALLKIISDDVFRKRIADSCLDFAKRRFASSAISDRYSSIYSLLLDNE